ncbi:hypothetical protein [Streptomyces antibioticus]|uniref:hypothetical protein n=1 Tax=Streptomyces antibioticus TaxID=1890 RepID=UPI001FD86C39|nr:hypothetical protein [Streptomyces antibioticus]
MKIAHRTILLASGALGALALLGGAAFLLRVPPFGQKGGIEASEVCASLGTSSSAAEALREVLPAESSYSFDDDVTSRVDATDTGYESACFVSGGGEQLLVADVRLMADEEEGSWTEWVRGTAASDASVTALTPFPAGKKAVASGRFAAVFVPCTSAGHIPGGQYNLSVSVELKKPGGAGAAANRAELIKLATNAASFAHTEAKCDLAR